MKKKYIQLGAVALLLVVMVAALMILRKPPEEVADASSEASDAVYVLGNAEGVKPTRIDITNEEDSYAIVNKAPDGESPELEIEGWENVSLDTYAMGGAFSAAGSMKATLTAAENADAVKLAEFGLDKPRATATITSGEGKEAILIGIDAPGGEGAYVQREGENNVYLITGSLAEPFLKPATMYVNKYATPTDPDSKGFDKLIFSGTYYPEPIVIERTPENETEISGIKFGTHDITSPIQSGVAMNSFEPIAAIFGIMTSEVAAVGDDTETLEKYGLKEPAVVASVTAPDKELSFTLKLSEPDDENNITLMKSGSPVIYKVGKDSLPWYGISLFELMNKLPLMPQIDTLKTVEVYTTEKTYLFELSGEGSDLKVLLDGKELPEVTESDGDKASGADNFRQFYQTLISASYDAPVIDEFNEGESGASETASEGSSDNTITEEASGETETDSSETEADGASSEKASGDTEASETASGENSSSQEDLPTESYDEVKSYLSANAVLEITYTYRQLIPADIVDFYPGPPRKYIIVVNGGTPYYCTQQYVERVLSDVVKIANGEAVKSFL